MGDQQAVRVLARAIDVLMVLTSGPQALGGVARHAQLSKTTAHRLLAGLTYQQLVIQDPGTGEYGLGPGCFRIVEAFTRGLGAHAVLAQPVMEALCQKTEETITMHARIGGQRICIAEFPSALPVRYTLGLGSVAPVHAGAAGKVLMAFLDESSRRDLLAYLPLERLTEHTVVDRQEIEAELALIRRKGWAYSHGERAVGGRAVSAPILDSDGRIVAALSVLGPDNRMSDDRLEDLAVLSVRAAGEITAMLRTRDECQATE